MPLQTISTITIPPTTTMSAHVVASNPHPQYLLASNLASAAKLQIKLNGLVDVNYTSAADGDILVHSDATWSLTNLNSIISGLTIYPATVSTYGKVILATYPDISNNVSSTVITPNLISSYVSMVSANIHREFSTAIDTSITNIPYATTTTSGRIRLATQAEANSSDFENADIVPAITPNVMRTYTSNYVSSYHGSYLQNMLSAGTGIYIDPSSVSTGSTVYNGIRVSDVPISEVVDLGTSLTTISTSLVNLDTSKQLLLARSGTYTSVITSVINQNTDSETNVDTVHCTIPYATTSEPGIVTLTNEITESNKNDSTTAVTPNALVNAVGELTGLCNVMWRHIGEGYYTSSWARYVGAADTSGFYKLTTFHASADYVSTQPPASLCLAIAWGKTTLLQVNNTVMFDIDVRAPGICKMEQVIAPILNIECYGGPEYYAVDATELKAANNKYRQGGANYDNIRYGGTASQIANDFNNTAARKAWAVDINTSDASGNYTRLASSRFVIKGRGNVVKQIANPTDKISIQTYEHDNVVVQYATAIHEKEPGYKDSQGLNPVTHLRAILNLINTARAPTICIHWCMIGLAPVDASAIWDGQKYENYSGETEPVPDEAYPDIRASVEWRLCWNGEGDYSASVEYAPVIDSSAGDKTKYWSPDYTTEQKLIQAGTRIFQAGTHSITGLSGQQLFNVDLPVDCYNLYMGKNGSDHPRSERVVTYELYRYLSLENDNRFEYKYYIKNLAFVGQSQNVAFYVCFKKLCLTIDKTNPNDFDLVIDWNNTSIESFDNLNDHTATPSDAKYSFSLNSATNPNLAKYTGTGTPVYNGSLDPYSGNNAMIADAEGVPCFGWRVERSTYKYNNYASGTVVTWQYQASDYNHRLQFIVGYSKTRIIFKVVTGAYDRDSEIVGTRIVCSKPDLVTYKIAVEDND